MSFGPEGDGFWTPIIEAVLVPLALISALASIVWGLQDRFSRISADVREAAQKRRSRENPEEEPSKDASFENMETLIQRARLLQRSVIGFYLSLFCQLMSAVFIGLSRLGAPAGVIAAPITNILILSSFFLGLLLLLGAAGLALVDTLRSYQAAMCATETDAPSL
jgi:hypothetical protein